MNETYFGLDALQKAQRHMLIASRYLCDHSINEFKKECPNYRIVSVGGDDGEMIVEDGIHVYKPKYCVVSIFDGEMQIVNFKFELIYIEEEYGWTNVKVKFTKPKTNMGWMAVLLAQSYASGISSSIHMLNTLNI